VTRALLKNLPAYRFGLTPLLRGLEIGLAHGYFLIGPFFKLGPLRNSDVALLAGFVSTIGLILILTLVLQFTVLPYLDKRKLNSMDVLIIFRQKKLGINLRVDFLLEHAVVRVLLLFVY
jgi:hypothetical protein